MAVLLNDVCYSALVELGVSTPEYYWLSSHFQGLKVCAVVVHGLLKEKMKKRRGSRMTWTGLWIE